jgi:predicted nucleotidyltransferase
VWSTVWSTAEVDAVAVSVVRVRSLISGFGVQVPDGAQIGPPAARRPKAVIEEHLAGIKGIERATIYGSWAARFHGEPGPQPNDIDVLVVGTADVAKVRAAADKATKSLGKDVNVSVLTPKEWTDPKTGFIRNVKDSPLVDLDLSA